MSNHLVEQDTYDDMFRVFDSNFGPEELEIVFGNIEAGMPWANVSENLMALYSDLYTGRSDDLLMVYDYNDGRMRFAQFVDVEDAEFVLHFMAGGPLVIRHVMKKKERKWRLIPFALDRADNSFGFKLLLENDAKNLKAYW